MKEFNFDGLVGPTHNYAGLALGNVASLSSRGTPSNPRAAALQGLEKMWTLARRGYPQAVLPPHPRPHISALRNWGFSGPDDAAILAHAAREAPELLAAAASASPMWTANATTITPSPDSSDGKLHITPANLQSKPHRAIEVEYTQRVFNALFADKKYFNVHLPLRGGATFSDEGAANHTRLAPEHESPGLHLHVYGRSDRSANGPAPIKFPARQTREACEAVLRKHGIPTERQFIIQQNPSAIDAGVFHNDVISVGNRNTFLYHECSFVDTPSVMDQLRERFQDRYNTTLHLIKVSADQISLQSAVKSYLFNSQLLDLPGGGILLAAPHECQRQSEIRNFINAAIQDPANPIQEVLYFDLRESMRNGGGPACLRLRVVLSQEEVAALNARVILDEPLYNDLRNWILRHYREQLLPADLADPALLEESQQALHSLHSLIQLF